MSAPIQTEAYSLFLAQQAVPLVMDSPHSSPTFPQDFNACLPLDDLRDGEDVFIDALWSHAPQHGAHLLLAEFARTYIDPNRHVGDVDLSMIDGEWPHTYVPSGKASIGKSLIWRTLDDGRPIYDRKLSIDEVQQRIQRYALPYQAQLQKLIDAHHQAFGVCYHINCHSMNAVSGKMGEGGAGIARADVVLGDRDGTTCDAEFTYLVKDFMQGCGYEVKINDPFKGVELVRAFSNPAQGKHSLQVELNKRLYTDATGRGKGASYDKLAQ
ncbi:MAG: N-formylglutamate amidohydrolase, partial [Betaproteobacteria bacterium]|nr:N-formylglutamate amidohydrolase [Betaproteobacteria bacterium]